MLLVVVGLDNIIGKQCLVATGRQKQFNIGVILGAAVNFVSNLILINIFGAKGAAIGSVIAECTILSSFIYFSRDIFCFSRLRFSFMRYAIIGAIMGIITWKAGTYLPTTIIGILIQIFVGIVIYFVFLVLFKDPMIGTIISKIKQNL